MSYCRWSTDDYQCDLYVYEAVGGHWSTTIAARRVVYATNLPPKVAYGPTKSEKDAYWARHVLVGEMHDAASHVPIGLPLDGQSFTDATAGECADRLESLLAMGYRFPSDVIVTLREEQAEADLLAGIFQADHESKEKR